jgi:hypothetical protein
MINNPERDIPNCRFRRENAYNEGEAGQQAVEAGTDQHSPSALGGPQVNADRPLLLDTWEPRDTPIEDLVHEIVRRTNEKAGRGEHVSAAPIILRVEYAHCANLTIYDTPGFRLGGDVRPPGPPCSLSVVCSTLTPWVASRKNCAPTSSAWSSG